MSCAGTESVEVSLMRIVCKDAIDVRQLEYDANTPRIKTGFLRRYNSGFFSKKWKQEFFVLYQDSTLAWYDDQGSYRPNGGVRLKTVCRFLAVGMYTRSVPNRPELAPGSSEHCLICAPQTASKTDKINWILCADEQEMTAWMTAISSVLPPPPQPPQQQQQQPQGPPLPGFQPGVMQGPPPQPGYPPPQQGGYPPPQQVGHPPPYQATQQAHYPQQGMAHQQQRVVHQQQPTQVVYRDRQRRRSSGSGFATGMLVGGALGYSFGRPYCGWGGGWGMGYGGGFGYGGGWGHGGGYHDTDVNIYNNYDVNNTNIENTNMNETNVENNEYYGDNGGYDDGGYGGYDDGGYDDGGYDDGGYDDGGFDGGDFDGGDFGD